MCNKEGLQIDKCRSKCKAPKVCKQKKMILCENWHDSGLQDNTKHFMCTRLDEMELVRNLGHRSYATHRIWLGQVTQFRNSYKVEPQKVVESIEYGGLEVGDH